MKYQDYIDLGFKRTETQDAVEYRNTGYYGYYLEKILTSKMSIYTSAGSLDKPKLYIKKSFIDEWHIIQITTEMVRDLLNEK